MSLRIDDKEKYKNVLYINEYKLDAETVKHIMHEIKVYEHEARIKNVSKINDLNKVPKTYLNNVYMLLTYALDGMKTELYMLEVESKDTYGTKGKRYLLNVIDDGKYIAILDGRYMQFAKWDDNDKKYLQLNENATLFSGIYTSDKPLKVSKSSFNKIANSDIFKKSYIQDELTKFFYIKNQTKAAEQKLAKNSEINAAYKKLLEFDIDFEKFFNLKDTEILFRSYNEPYVVAKNKNMMITTKYEVLIPRYTQTFYEFDTKKAKFLLDTYKALKLNNYENISQDKYFDENRKISSSIDVLLRDLARLLYIKQNSNESPFDLSDEKYDELKNDFYKKFLKTRDDVHFAIGALASTIFGVTQPIFLINTTKLKNNLNKFYITNNTLDMAKQLQNEYSNVDSIEFLNSNINSKIYKQICT